MQYFAWLGRLGRGDLGTSFRSRRPILTEMAQRVPATAALAGAAFAIQTLLALGLGSLAARRPGGIADRVASALSIVLVALPTYWVGLLLLWVFAVHLGWVTVSGPPEPRRLVLPALTLGLALTPPALRVFRTSLVEQYRRAHVAVARAKGLPERAVLRRHVAPLALLPTVTLLGISLTEALGGAVIVETIFAWPGLGKYLMDSILARDYPVVQGYVLFATTTVVAGSLLVDLICGLLDPRLRTPAAA